MNLRKIFYFFFLMWELELILVYLLLSMWGGKRYLDVVTKCILYIASGFIFILIGALTMGLYRSNEPTLDFQILANKSYPTKLKIILYLSFSIAYVVKLSIIPFYTWLLDTHGEAHYNTCMLLVRIILKMEGYGIIQINMKLSTHAHSIFAPWLVLIGAIPIVYATLTEKRVDSQLGFQKEKGFQ